MLIIFLQVAREIYSQRPPFGYLERIQQMHILLVLGGELYHKSSGIEGGQYGDHFDL
jgi:hypothetical protein